MADIYNHLRAHTSLDQLPPSHASKTSMHCIYLHGDGGNDNHVDSTQFHRVFAH